MRFWTKHFHIVTPSSGPKTPGLGVWMGGGPAVKTICMIGIHMSILSRHMWSTNELIPPAPPPHTQMAGISRKKLGPNVVRTFSTCWPL